jgi:hypothetical protein
MMVEDNVVKIVDWEGAVVIGKVSTKWKLLNHHGVYDLGDSFDLGNPVVREFDSME